MEISSCDPKSHPKQRGNVGYLKGPFINTCQDIFQHRASTLHKQIIIHIETDKAVHIQSRHKFIDMKFVKELLDLVDRSAQSRRIIEKLGLRRIGKFVRPESQRIVDANESLNRFYKALAIRLQF